jgi:endonuclease/exonuclease/phosphatase family metal-dependent hydrolase
MKEIESGSFSTGSLPRVWPETLRVVSWNINRGLQLDGIVQFLSQSRGDLILLQEADINALRTANKNVPREVAQALQMDYIFGREFQELAQGSVVAPAYHGQATLSRLPLSHPRVLRFRDQSSFWSPRWFIPHWQCLQRRLGGRIALICEITLQNKTLAIYNAHLESRGNDDLRISQISEMLADITTMHTHTAVVLAGDFNLDVSVGSAAALLGRAQINNPFAHSGKHRTVPNSRRAGSAAIDWILTAGAITLFHTEIHMTVPASDHFPISLEFRCEYGENLGPEMG